MVTKISTQLVHLKMTSVVTVNNEFSLEEEFWVEAGRTMKERLDDEDLRGNITDEGELEADWLADVGLGDLSQQWRQGKSLPENDIGPAVQKLSLKPHQADAVRKRVQTLNATLKRKKHNRKPPPDVRSFFQNDEVSRSATPDSLGSSSEYLNSSSVTTSDHSPPRRQGSQESPPLLESLPSLGSSGDELDDAVPPLPNQHVPEFVSIFDTTHPHSNALVHGKPKDLFRPPLRFPARSSHTNSDSEVATDVVSGIEMLNYHNIGTIYMKGYIPPKPQLQARHSTGNGPISLPPNNKTNNSATTVTASNNSSEINSRTYSTSALFTSQNGGFTEELNRKNMSGHQVSTSVDHSFGESDEKLIDECTYIVPSGLTRLSDLSEDDVKKIYPLLLMELTAQCDHLGIQLRRKKKNAIPNGNGVKKPNGTDEGPTPVFGVNLEVLLAKDRRITRDNSLEVPIAFEKMVSHLWKRSLGDEGLLRMAGHKGKINDLRATFESSLYTEPEQVTAAMNNCSSHDVANLLKQFLRELPVPLLGCDTIDTFFDVAGHISERNQESCLRLLLLLLPQSHQAVLRMLIQFLRDLIRNSEVNKMSLRNVALILAPNLIPGSALRSQNKEINRAVTSVQLTSLLIKYGATLFNIPTDLLSQMRQINDNARYKKQKSSKSGQNGNGHKGSSTNGQVSKQHPASIYNSLKVSAPQLGFPEVVLPIQPGSTAGDIVLFLLEEGDRKAEYLERESDANVSVVSVPCAPNTTTVPVGLGPINGNNMNNANARRRAVGQKLNQQDGGKNSNAPNLSCLLTQVDRETALKTHSLYEYGGNIGYRRIDPSALIAAICRDNPGAAWALRCNHRHSPEPAV